MSRAMLIALLALAIAVAAMVLAITRHSNPRVAKLRQYAFPPQLESVEIGDSPREVRRRLGPPRAVHRFRSPRETCWDYVFPASTPRYRLCFLRGRLVTRTPI